MNVTQFLTIVVQAGTFIAAFAGIAASIVMFSITKKFGLGILAASFKTISLGVIFIALGMVVDALNSYLQLGSNVVVASIVILKEAFFVVGTYIIVIGAKNTADKLEKLS
mgnify:CR=1 FL=1